MEDLKKIIAKNITDLRTAKGITQLELAEKLMYSDKNISKWERAEAVPDVVVLKTLADMYGITVNDFLVENNEKLAKLFKELYQLKFIQKIERQIN